jgi:leucyl-tRNA synthetase
MDTFMCSSWYFLRYTSSHSDTAAFDPDRTRYWLPVDLYTGGAEHAVMHLLYARFFAKAIRDMGLVNFDEPFSRLFNQGIIIADKHKMSKSRGNVVTPDEYVSELGADAVRAYLMFIGPWEQGGEWDDSGISGISRWLNRLWKLVLAVYGLEMTDATSRASVEASKELKRITHQTIRKVTQDLEKMRFNTMLAALMELTNYLMKENERRKVSPKALKESIDSLLLLLAPTAPHLTEELWQRTGHSYSINNQSWPKWDEALAKDEEITLVVQINGKLRDRITVPASIAEDEARKLVLERPRVKTYVEGKKIAKIIYIPGRLVNLVVRGKGLNGRG